MDNLIMEILSEQSEHLIHGKRLDLNAYLSRAPQSENELRPLLNLAERVQRALVPVSPTRVFRDRLREGLMLAASHRQTHNLIQVANPNPWRYWWVGAAALGSAVAAGGIIAWIVRMRQRTPVLEAARAKIS